MAESIWSYFTKSNAMMRWTLPCVSESKHGVFMCARQLFIVRKPTQCPHARAFDHVVILYFDQNDAHYSVKVYQTQPMSTCKSFTCHMSHVTCHVSRVTCWLPITAHFVSHDLMLTLT